jgi:hypothetical protein
MLCLPQTLCCRFAQPVELLVLLGLLVLLRLLQQTRHESVTALRGWRWRTVAQ